MKQFMKAGKWQFPVMMSPDAVAMAYEIQVIPTVVVIDPEGAIVETLVGGATASELSDMVDDLTS